MKNINFEKLITQIETLMRDGQAQKTADILLKLPLTKIPRAYRAPLADLCRRGGYIHQGLRILSFVVNPDKEFGPPKPAEIASYAVLLQKNSSLAEALQLLNQVDPAAAPEALLYRSFCYFNRWEYEAAIPLLKSYRGLCTSPYAGLLANVNLASALLATGQWDEAVHQLNENIELAEPLSAHRLTGNCLEMRAQYYIHKGDLNRAEADLEESQKRIGPELTSDQLFILKWKAVLESARQKSVEPLKEFKLEAHRRRHWESVRETDLHILKTEFRSDLFNFLYFGTPFDGYRRRIERELGKKPTLDKLMLGSGSGPFFDIESGKSNPEGLVNPGEKLHQVLDILWRDFYQPTKLGSLFAEIFPDEHFNAWSSPGRIHQLLRRTRRQIEEKNFPISIVDDEGGYRVHAGPGLTLLVPQDRKIINRDQILLDQLRQRLGGSNFSAGEASKALEISTATVLRLLRRGQELGHVQCSGNGPATKYSLVS